MAILVVEDHPLSAQVLQVILHRARYETVQAGNGKAAIEALESHPDIDLVITDIMMPDVDGFALIERMRTSPEWQDIPIIIQSAAANAETVTRAREMGVRRFVVKPINAQLMLQQVRELLHDQPPVLGDPAGVITRLSIDREAYAGLAQSFAALVREKVTLLDDGLKGEPDATAVAGLVEQMAGISESAALFGAVRAERLLDRLRRSNAEAADLVARTAELKRLCRELRRLQAALPSPGPGAAAGPDSPP